MEGTTFHGRGGPVGGDRMKTPGYPGRYVRQVSLDGFGPEAQRRLAEGHVLIVGAGGLGSPAILYLAGAGVGRLTIVDDDFVEESNLHRQVVHHTDAVGEPKALSAAAAARSLNPQIAVCAHRGRVTAATARELVAGVDVVLDGSDNFATRHAVSAACARREIPHVWGSVLGFEAQFSVFWAGHGPVYEDLYPRPPAPGTVPSCAEAGVLGPVVGETGVAMALEAVKLLADVGTPLVGTIGYFDGLSGRWDYLPLRGDPAVGKATAAGRYLQEVPTVTGTEGAACVVDVREPDEFRAGHIPDARNIPLSSILHEEAPPPPDRPLVVYCQSGVRSQEAVRAWLRRGYTGVASLVGGWERWSRREPVDPGGTEN